MTHRLYVAVLETRGYIVGGANAPSGLHRYEGGEDWTHLGWRNVRSFGLAAVSGRPEVLFMAAGNGLFRTLDGGASWRITTGWEIAEVLDVAIDPHAPEQVYIATAYGIWHSPDLGGTWAQAGAGIPTPAATFTQALAVDRVRSRHLLAGTEDGLYRSTDGAQRWAPVGPRRVPVRDLKQSGAVPDLWLAGTEDHGVLVSRDGGHSWHRAAGEIGRATVYAVALDPNDPLRMAAAGYETDVCLSTDGGVHWRCRRAEAPACTVHALAFDPDAAHRLWVGTVGEGVFCVDSPYGAWTYAGLDGATVYDMIFREVGP